jgi:photosystem II stability/assembly factor-like uncharacterized protein
LRGVSITPDGRGIVAVGAGGLVWRSSDGGASFARVSGGGADLNAVGFADDAPGQGWAVGAAGTILRTTDGGAHFAPIDSPLVVDLTSLEDFG